MSLSRKNYEEVAKIIGGNIEAAGPTPPLRTAHDAGFLHGVEWVARDLADYFAADNPGFDRARFLAACGVEA